MKKTLGNLVGGLVGAAVLNIVHQAVAQFNEDAPRVDKVGEEALSKGLDKVGVQPPQGEKLFLTTLAADVISNAAYYSLIGMARRKNIIGLGLASGLIAGAGALALTKPMGLDDKPITRTKKTKYMTVAWYAIGGLAAGLVIKSLRK